MRALLQRVSSWELNSKEINVVNWKEVERMFQKAR